MTKKPMRRRVAKKARNQSFFRERRPGFFDAAVLVFDIEGFTRFCSRPQVDPSLPRFLNRTFHHVATQLDPDGSAKLPFEVDGVAPVHYKFLGDGGLVIWPLPGSYAGRKNFFLTVLDRLFLARRGFPDVARTIGEELGISDPPNAIRFGLAVGDVAELRSAGGAGNEYVGFPINLASRLQSYSRPLGLIASARVGLIDEELDKRSFVRVKAKFLKGLDPELVLVDAADYQDMASNDKQELFED